MDIVTKNLTRSLYFLVITVLVVQLTGCGYFLYPERRGQTSGRIDAGVAILDGVGLLFFLIPGVIAYAVDFSSGTIYLPGTGRSSREHISLRKVKFDPRHTTLAQLEKIIRKETGQQVAFGEAGMKVVRLQSIDEMKMEFAMALPQMRQDERLSYNR